MSNYCIPDMVFNTFYSNNDVSRNYFGKMHMNATKTEILYNLDAMIENCLAIKYGDLLNLRRYNQCMSNRLKNEVYGGQEISPHEAPFGPAKFDYMEGFDPVQDCVYQYRWNVSNDLFKCGSVSSLGSSFMNDLCDIITPKGKGLISPRCYYNYYIDIALDDEDKFGMHFTEHTDAQVYIGFKKIKCRGD